MQIHMLKLHQNVIKNMFIIIIVMDLKYKKKHLKKKTFLVQIKTY